MKFLLNLFSRLPLIALAILLSSSATAHTFSTSNALVDFTSDNRIEFSLETDLINLLQQQLKLRGTNDELIEQIRRLRKIELFKLLHQSNLELQHEIKFYLDDKITLLTQLHPPNFNQIGLLLTQNPGVTNYRVKFTGYLTRPTDTKSFSVHFPTKLGEVYLKISTSSSQLISSGNKSDIYNLEKQNISDFALKISNSLNYLFQGIIHIIPKGFDHILFVLALFLLSSSFSALLWQVSAFTVAHTITLALGVFGVFNIPSSIVEPIIALSICYVAIENIFQHKLKTHRLAIVFSFGLLHGLGFATVLIELGLPQNQQIISLLSFNVGVEIGQLLVIVCAFVLLGWARNKPYYQSKITTPLSLLIALTGAYWFVERAFF